MLKVYCKKCNTAYQIKADKVPLSGGKLKCSVCNNIIPIFNKNSTPKPAPQLPEKLKNNQPNSQTVKKKPAKNWFPSDISEKVKKKPTIIKVNQENSHRGERLLRLITNSPLYLILIDLILLVILFFTNFNIELRRMILTAVTLSSALIIFSIILLLAHFDRKERQKAKQDSVHELFLFCYPLYLFKRAHASKVNPINKIIQNLIFFICFIIVYNLILRKLLSISRNILEKLQI